MKEAGNTVYQRPLLKIGATMEADKTKTNPPTPEPPTSEPPTPEPSTPEPPTPGTSAYESIMEQQAKQIEALIKQNENLTAQVTRMIETGTQIRDNGAGEGGSGPDNTSDNYRQLTKMDENDDYSMKYLGSFIGGKK